MLLGGVVWGLSPLFYKLLDHIPAMEVVSHRILFSFLTFAILLAYQKRLGVMWQQMTRTRREFARTFLAASMISVNWFVWVLAVQLGLTTEASLGYFIFPLFAVVLGIVIFHEKLSPVQWLAVAIAGVAVLVLTIGQGTAPWIALILATSFSVYGAIKKQSPTGPVVSVSAEAMLVSPLALLWLMGTHLLGWTGFTGLKGGYFGADLGDTLLLASSGIMTAGPLILLSYAIRRLRYAEIGLLQYTNPTLQFLVAVLIFMEPFGPIQLISFSMIWLALALYSADLLRQDRRLRSLATASSGDSARLNKSQMSASAKPSVMTLSIKRNKGSQ